LICSASRQTRPQATALASIALQLVFSAAEKPFKSSSGQPGSSENGMGRSRASDCATVTTGSSSNKEKIQSERVKNRDRDTARCAVQSDQLIPDSESMWLIFLEAGVALALLLFIVWWTMRGKR
jgi:cobalamin biosynthesis Mg chelatase CobN